MKKLRSGKHNPIITLKKDFSFPKTKIAIKSSLHDVSFSIINSNETIDVFYAHAPGESGSGTKCNYFWMTYGNFGDDEKVEAWEVFKKALEIADILSLLVNELYFDPNVVETYIFPGSLSSNVQLKYPSKFTGLQINNINLPNKQIDHFLNKISKLKIEDYKYFRSSIFLLKQAKKRFYKGENSGVIADAVSAVEALYLRPDKNGYYNRDYDSRFTKLKKKRGLEEKFKSIFNNSILYSKFRLTPYAIRSGHLHSGEIDFYYGERPRNNDKFMNFILECQKIIIGSLNIFK
ncbi:hypothetical protein CL633_00600 [bacterium]|nr:hypothetical protein [bacterium]|tara:strand:- start:31321 stop:32193 length:873 start_codon:yes stop_codon:yes gene_type:complete